MKGSEAKRRTVTRYQRGFYNNFNETGITATGWLVRVYVQ